MQLKENTLCNLDNPNAGLVLFSLWEVEGKNDKEAVAQASIDNIATMPWPEGLISYSCYLATKGNTLLHYSQWENEQAHLDYVEKQLPERLELLKNDVSIKSRELLGKYRLYRSMKSERAIEPGCIVVVQQEFKNPGMAAPWIDTVFEAIASEDAPVEGLISGHFHISYDGLSMVNFAQWTSEQAHIDALARSERGTIGISPLWKKVTDFPGLKQAGNVNRYTFYKNISKTQEK